jgi:hypothetical protein
MVMNNIKEIKNDIALDRKGIRNVLAELNAAFKTGNVKKQYLLAMSLAESTDLLRYDLNRLVDELHEVEFAARVMGQD